VTELVFLPAVRERTPVFIALAGPSGSGKTRSALELATGLAGPGRIAVADSEGRRALHYRDMYEFDHLSWQPPYTPKATAGLIDAAEKGGYAVLIVDSASDEYEGQGGLLEMHEGAGKSDEFWAKTKAQHKHWLVNRIRRAAIHTIWCLRAEERVKISEVGGRASVEHLGWQPICEKRFLYEMQSSFIFDVERPGVPRPIKLYDIHAQFFPRDKPITREAGAALATWAAGGALPSAGARQGAVEGGPRSPVAGDTTYPPVGAQDALDRDSLVAEAWAAARQGMAVLEAYWSDLKRAERRLIGADLLPHLKDAASEADEVDKLGFGEGKTEDTKGGGIS